MNLNDEPGDVLIATFNDHVGADNAVRQLIEADFDKKHLSVIGKGYHTEEKVIGFVHTGDKIKMWGKYGAFWGALWGVLFGGVFIAMPVLGPIVAVGYFASVLVSAAEGAVVVGGISALTAALFSVGISKEHAIHYETAIMADGFMVMAHGSKDELARARQILDAQHPLDVTLHHATDPAVRQHES